jgi:hypothetical protein
MSGGRLVEQALNAGEEASSMQVLTRMELNAVWGGVSRGRVSFDIDGEVCNGVWALPIDRQEGAVTGSGLVRMQTRGSEWSAVRRIVLPESVGRPLHDALLNSDVWNCEVEASVEKVSGSIECRVRNLSDGGWHAILRVCVDGVDIEYALIPDGV